MAFRLKIESERSRTQTTANKSRKATEELSIKLRVSYNSRSVVSFPLQTKSHGATIHNKIKVILVTFGVKQRRSSGG
jgi:predicted alpha/beta superfamily hydrolase